MRIGRGFVAGMVLTIAVLAGCGASPGTGSGQPPSQPISPSPSPAPSPSPTAAAPAGLIAFVRHGGGRSDIFVIRADGSGLRQLTDDDNLEGTLIWLLDGSRLLYLWSTQQDPYHDHLVSVRPDGTEPRELGVVQTYDAPVWSPDGTKVAFGGDGDDRGETGVFVVDLVGGTLKQLTGDGATFAHWSPDGTRLAAILPARRLEIIDAQTGAQLTVVEDESVQAPVGWTSDSSIAFSGCPPEMNKEECMAAPLVEVDADGSNPRPYIGDLPFRIEDVRSPDGRWIAVSRDDTVYVRAAATESPEVSLGQGDGPSWSPDSAWLVFRHAYRAPVASGRSGPFRLVIAPRAGGTPITLTDGPYDSSPAWQPA